MSRKTLERTGFYLSRLGLFVIMLLLSYLLFAINFIIHPESEVSMMTSLPVLPAASGWFALPFIFRVITQ